ncbi:hypothetical protein FN976_11310 [Caenimonas sedimenti]|uniref:Conjugal transfer protein TraB n=1 Tax=Caenimonas sedimenti TaxID=2596921 RepID=A0A562ZTM5_9BURK|nr:hypothetical protein [Caenimonas sedimenti]TWO71494.1 hypothetical protein FN976_11310 [Caenimonas sedimenti]
MSGAPLRTRAIEWLAMLAGGAVVGTVAWGEGRVPIVAALLPLALSLCARRSLAVALAFGYTLGVMRHTGSFIGTWFGDSLVIGFGAVLIYAALASTTWSLCWTRSQAPSRKGLALLAGWAVTLAPPAALILPGHPVIVAGFIAPGAGWWGVAASALVPAALAVGAMHFGLTHRTRVTAVLIAVVALAGVGLTVAPRAPLAVGIQGQMTEWGAPQSDMDGVLARIQAMGQAPAQQSIDTVVWPESVIGRYEPVLFPVLEIELLQPARRAGQVQLVGMDIPVPGRGLLNAAIAFYPDGNSTTAVARQPAPVSLWRPWEREATFIADWSARNVLPLGPDRRAAVIFCYEEYMPVLYLLNELRDHPTHYVALANTWAARRSEQAAIQRLHSMGMASLFGRPYVRAENRPAPAGASWSPSVAP